MRQRLPTDPQVSTSQIHSLTADSDIRQSTGGKSTRGGVTLLLKQTLTW